MRRFKTSRYTIFIILILGVMVYGMTPALGSTVMQIIEYLASLGQGTVFVNTIDIGTPAGSDAPSVIDNKIREAKAGWQERLNVDHAFQLTGQQVSDPNVGEHNKITFAHSISNPTQVSGTAHLYLQADELRYQDDTTTAFDLTDEGTLNIQESDLLGTVTNDTFFTVIDFAGTGTIDLIKGDANDVVVIPDNAETATTAAPAFQKSIVNKKYVDDTIPDEMDPLVYTGGESVTFANGLIIKMGTLVAIKDNTVALSYDDAFPNDTVSVICSRATATIGFNFSWTIRSFTDSGFTFHTSADGGSYNWIALGY